MINEFIKRAQELRTAFTNAETDFFEYLYEQGQNHTLVESINRDCGKTYEQFIEEMNLIRATRYLAWASVRKNQGAEAVRSVGVNGVIAAARFKSADDQREMLARVALCERTNGTSISEQTASAIASDIRKERVVLRPGGRKGMPALLDEIATKDGLIAKLTAENKALRAQLRTAESKLRAAERELVKLTRGAAA